MLIPFTILCTQTLTDGPAMADGVIVCPTTRPPGPGGGARTEQPAPLRQGVVTLEHWLDLNA